MIYVICWIIVGIATIVLGYFYDFKYNNADIKITVSDIGLLVIGVIIWPLVLIWIIKEAISDFNIGEITLINIKRKKKINTNIGR